MVRNLIVQNGKGWKLPYPASSWEDGILLGNGNMGADAWGDGEFETITLTQEHLYAPRSIFRSYGLLHAPDDTGKRKKSL